MCDLLAEGFAGEAAFDHQIERLLGLADGAHTVMDAAGAEAELRNLEAAAFAEQDIFLRHADVVEAHVHVTARRVVVTEHMHRPDHLDARRVDRHQDLRLLLARCGVRVGLHHHDHDLAAWIAKAGDVIFLAVDDPLVAVEARGGGDVLGVRRGNLRLGHHIGGTDFAVQQGFEPLLLLLLGADPLQHFHVAGVRRRAVHRFRAERILAEFGGDEGIVEVRETFAGLGVRQEEVPEALRLRLALDLGEQLKLLVGEAPAVGLALAGGLVFRLNRGDRFLQELADVVVERPRFLRHAEIVEFVVRVETEAGRCGGVHVHDTRFPPREISRCVDECLAARLKGAPRLVNPSLRASEQSPTCGTPSARQMTRRGVAGAIADDDFHASQPAQARESGRRVTADSSSAPPW